MDDPFDDGEYRDRGSQDDDDDNNNNNGKTNPNFFNLMRKMWGKKVDGNNFDFLNDDESSNDHQQQQQNYNGRQQQQQQQQKKRQQKDKTKKTTPNRRRDDDDDDDDDDEDHNRRDDSNANSNSNSSDNGGGDSNIGGNTKKDQENRFFGFKGEEFINLNEMDGDMINDDVNEKKHLEELLKKCNSTVQKERDEARKIITARKVVHPQVRKTFCRVCEFVDANLFGLQRFSDAELAPSQFARQYDLAACGHKDEQQLFHETANYYNAYKVKVSGTAGQIDSFFTTYEIANCFRNHNKMNIKRPLLNAIHTAKVLKKEALRHVKGKTITGQNIFQPMMAKLAMELAEKEVNLTARLIQADMMIHESGLLSAHKNGPISNRMLISTLSKKDAKNGASVYKSSFYNKTAPTGKYATHTM